MRKISPTSIVTIGVVASTILGLLRVMEVLPEWWIVFVPVIFVAVYIVIYMAIAVIEEFKY